MNIRPSGHCPVGRTGPCPGHDHRAIRIGRADRFMSPGRRSAVVQYVFGDFALDPDRRELTRNAEAIAIGPQVFDLLLFLVRNRERVVSKDDLLDAVWSGRIVSEVDADQPHQCGAQGDRRQRRGTAPDPDDRAQGLPVRRRRQGGRHVRRRVPAADGRSHQANRAGAGLPDSPSIAVLPFQNWSGDPEQDYFADGMVEDIITALVAHPLAVRHRAQFKLHLQGPGRGREAGGPRAGRALCARRQRAQGGQPRSHHRAADRYRVRSASLGGAFRRHARRCLRIAGSGGRECRRCDRADSWNAPRSSAPSASRPKACDAYDYYLRGMASFHRGTKEAIGDALPLFTKAIAARSGFRVGLCDGGVVPFLAQDQWLDDGSPIGDRRGYAIGPRAVELGKDDAVALARGGHALVAFHRRPRRRHRVSRQGADAQSEPCGGLVPQRLPAESGAANPTTRSSASSAPCA